MHSSLKHYRSYLTAIPVKDRPPVNHKLEESAIAIGFEQDRSYNKLHTYKFRNSKNLVTRLTTGDSLMSGSTTVEKIN